MAHDDQIQKKGLTTRPPRPSDRHRWVSTKRVTDWAGRVLEEEGYWYDGPWALAHGDSDLRSVGFAFYEAGTEAGSTEISEDTTESLSTDTTYLCRILITENAGNDSNNSTFQWQYQNTTKSTGWTNITTTSSHIRAVSGNLTNDGSTTNRHSGGGGTFQGGNGQTTDGTSGGNACDIPGNGHHEAVLEFQVRSADVDNGDSIEIRMTAVSTNDPSGITQTTVASLTASEPVTKSLSYTGTGTASLTKEVRKALNVSGTGTFVNYIRPRVWLNSTQTKSGADEMTVTAYNLAGTSITFTDPSGGQTGSLQLGVEKLKTGDLGWIAVTVNEGGVTQKTLTYTGTGTATLSKEVRKSLSQSGVGTPTVAKAVSKDTFSSTGTGTSTVTKQVGKDTFASTGTGTADLTNQIGKPLSYSGTGSSAVTKAVTKDTFSTTGTGTSSVLKAVDKAAFAITAVGTAALSKTKVTLKTLTFTGTGTSTVAKQVGKPLSMSGTGSSAFSKLASYAKTLSFTGTGSSSVTKQVGLDTKSFSGVGTASESHIKTKLRTYSYSGVGTASLTKVVQYARSFSASGVGSVGINREMGYTFAYSGVGTPTYSDITQFKRSLSFTGVGTSAPVDVETGIEINPSMTGTGTSTLGRAISVIKGIFGIGTASLSHDGDAGDPGWMDGVMTEEEWWARRRKMKRRMMKIMGVKRLSK